MAASDAKIYPVKNAAYRVTFPIYDNDGDLVSGAAGLDSEVSKDAATFADCTNEATEIATSSGIYYLDLTATEMNADTVVVKVKSTTTDSKDTVLIFYPLEDGDISGVDVSHFGGTAGTFAAGRPEVNASHISGSATPANALESVFGGTGVTDDIDVTLRSITVNSDAGPAIDLTSSNAFDAVIEINTTNGPGIQIIGNTLSPGIEVTGNPAIEATGTGSAAGIVATGGAGGGDGVRCVAGGAGGIGAYMHSSFGAGCEMSGQVGLHVYADTGTTPGMLIESSGTNDHAVEIVGNGVGSGVHVTGGATGDAVTLIGGATSGAAMAMSSTSGSFSFTIAQGVEILNPNDHAFVVGATGTNHRAVSITAADTPSGGAVFVANTDTDTTTAAVWMEGANCVYKFASSGFAEKLDASFSGTALVLDGATADLEGTLTGSNFASRGEPAQGAPAASTDPLTKLDYLYKSWRNKKDNDGSTTQLYDDAGTTVDHKQSTSESGGTVTKDEWVTGP